MLKSIQSYEDGSFLGSKWSICPKQAFFGEKSLILFSSTYWPISLSQIFNKFLQQTQGCEDASFLDPKWANFPQRKFFRKPVDKPSFCHSSLSTFQKSKSDINLLMKYWWSKNTSWNPFVESQFWPQLENQTFWEPDFSQTCRFHRMLKDHKNFRFTPIPDKANDFILLKILKNVFDIIFFSKKYCSVTNN